MFNYRYFQKKQLEKLIKMIIFDDLGIVQLSHIYSFDLFLSFRINMIYNLIFITSTT